MLYTDPSFPGQVRSDRVDEPPAYLTHGIDKRPSLAGVIWLGCSLGVDSIHYSHSAQR